MITTAHVASMARYNRWQNQNLYTAADGLSDEERKCDRGAFFKSIHGTLSHILFGDQIWLHRFAGLPKRHRPRASPTRQPLCLFGPEARRRAEAVR